MEVLQTENYYIFVRIIEPQISLWWNRTTNEFTKKLDFDFTSFSDIECIGVTEGIIGVVSLPGVYEPHLVVIRKIKSIGQLYPQGIVNKIVSICLLSGDEPDCDLPPCDGHAIRLNSTIESNRKPIILTAPSSAPPASTSTRSKLFDSTPLVKTWGAVKSAGSTIRSTTQQAATLASNQVRSSVGIKDPIRIEKRISEELHKMFDDSDNFYYGEGCDLTNTLQRGSKHNNHLHFDNPDKRFFWNMYMIKDLLKLQDDKWILPIIQGFVEIENCIIEDEIYRLSLISRRSRFRAGTRYKRRGVDEKGHCANYVETEQILTFRNHNMAFTQVRGSVPVYWSQPGYKYRPPPRLDRNEEQTQVAFEKHFQKELKRYKGVCIINLVNQSGKEKIIFDSYGKHIANFNNEHLTYVTYDFHEHCRGMRTENLSTLIEAIEAEVKAMAFHWCDPTGPICDQKSVCRVNCMDCLDRTNVVQKTIGINVLKSQLVKLGLITPQSSVPKVFEQPLGLLWANNGDIISRQYAGTNALKGDVTRTGERNFTGLFKDGMNSANRYIIQHFADTFRQSIIDLMLGNVQTYLDLKEDDVFDTILAVAETALIPTSIPAPPKNGYFNFGLMETEIRLTESGIRLASYYLARFKDAYRQATIDLMLGNNISPESLTALGGGQPPIDETDALEAAEHARLLIEDCRRVLLGAEECLIGSWGLIDADPSFGDPDETEVDSILLLVDSYCLIAEYDSHLDKITSSVKIPLSDLRLVEFGLCETSTKRFQGENISNYCIRLNYCVQNEEGYFHMFRSPNIRFFNNVAVVIKSDEEIKESLMSIVEFFRITLESLGYKWVEFYVGGKLETRKNRRRKQANDIPRNRSESQLFSTGSKAISNIAGQFSKFSFKSTNSTVNSKSTGNTNNQRLGNIRRFENSVMPPVIATDHVDNANGKQLEEAEEAQPLDVVPIFDLPAESLIIKELDLLEKCGDRTKKLKRFRTPSEHQIKLKTNKYEYVEDEDDEDYDDDDDADDADVDEAEEAIDKEEYHTHAPNTNDLVDLMSDDIEDNNPYTTTDVFGLNVPKGQRQPYDDEEFPNSPAPEIHIEETVDIQRTSSETNLKNVNAISNVGGTGSSSNSQSRSLSARDLTLPLKSSQSENALKQLKTLTSPLSKLAKGMQNLSMSLDPRKMNIKSPMSPQAQQNQQEEQPNDLQTIESTSERDKLYEKWNSTKCKTKLIAL